MLPLKQIERICCNLIAFFSDRHQWLLSSYDINEAEKWIKAIYAYQQNKKRENNNINTTGYLIPSGQTNQHLKEDVRQNISNEF